MKVLIVYGGPNNGLKKDLAAVDSKGRPLINKHSLKNLNPDSQYFISTIQGILQNQKVAPVDQIDIKWRHMNDLQEYLYIA